MTRPIRREEDEARREKLWKARAVARFLVEAWERTGGHEIQEQKLFCKRVGLTDAKTKAALINAWFPVAARDSDEGRNTLWSMKTLCSILRWDDPVMMLKPLVRVDPAAWGGMLEQAMSKATSQVLEEVVRGAFDDLRQQVVRFDDPLVLEDWKLYQENEARRPV